MADNDLIQAALSRGYSIDEIADKIGSESGLDISLARERGYSSQEILGRLGYSLPTREEVPDMTAGSVARDVGAGLLQIGPTAVKGFADIARMATGDRVGKDTSDAMETGIKAIKETVGSDRAQAQQRNFDADMANPNVGIGDALLNNKGALADQILPTVGSMFLPVGAAGAAGKLATAGRAVQGMDAAAIAARVSSAQQAAGIGAIAAQNSADTFTTLLEKGASMEDAYIGAGITVPFSIIAGKLTGGGAEMALTRAITGSGAIKTGVAEIGKGAFREGAQEVGEEAGQITGEAVGMDQAPTLNEAGKRLAVAGTLGAVMGGGVDAATQLQPKPTEQDILGRELNAAVDGAQFTQEPIDQSAVNAMQGMAPQTLSEIAPRPTVADISAAPDVETALDHFASVVSDVPSITLPAQQAPTPIDMEIASLEQEAAQVDQTQLLAEVEATLNPTGTLTVSGKGAADAVRSLGAEIPFVTRKDGSVLVSARFAEPVAQAIQQIHQLETQQGIGNAPTLDAQGNQGSGDVGVGSQGNTQPLPEVGVGRGGDATTSVPNAGEVASLGVAGAVDGAVDPRFTSKTPAELIYQSTRHPDQVIRQGAAQELKRREIEYAYQQRDIQDQLTPDQAVAMEVQRAEQDNQTGAAVDRAAGKDAPLQSPLAAAFEKAKQRTAKKTDAELKVMAKTNPDPVIQEAVKVEQQSRAQTVAVNAGNEQKSTTQQPIVKRDTSGLAARDDLVGAIMRVTGNKGIDSGMAQTITGDKAGSGNPKLRGLFLKDGTMDLGDVAELLRVQENFDVRDGDHLSELIRNAAAGDVAVSMGKTEDVAAANEEAARKDYYLKRAEELGIKKIGGKRKLEQVVADVEAKEAEIEAEQKRLSELEAAAERQAIQAADILEDGEVSEAEFMQLLSQTVDYTEDEINAAIVRSQERADRQAEEIAGFGADEETQGSVGEGNGNRTATPEGSATESGTRGAAEAGITVSNGEWENGAGPPGTQKKRFIAKDKDGSRIGTLLLYRDPDGSFDLSDIAVADEHQRKGVATSMMDAAFKDSGAESIKLSTGTTGDGTNFVNGYGEIRVYGKRRVARPSRLGLSTVNAESAPNLELTGETNAEAAANAARTESDEVTKAQADRERDAAPFSLATESQPKPVGVQGDLGIKFSKVSDAPVGEELVAIHNLSAENVLHADAIGGIPVPSIGITKSASPFTGFGEITLIASNDMIDPDRGVPVFDRDAYTARFPTLNYKKVTAKKADAFYERMNVVRDLGDDGASFISQLWDAIKNDRTQSPDKVSRLFQTYTAPRMLYAKEVLGKEFKVPMRPIERRTFFGHEKSWRDFVKNNAELKRTDEDAYNKLAAKAIRIAADEYLEREGKSEHRSIFMEEIDRYAGNGVNWNYLDRAIKDATDFGKKRIDAPALVANVDKVVKQNDPAYLKWISAQMDGLFAEPTITLRGREVEASLDNVVDAMTIGATQGAEKTMTFGVGKTSALLGKRFKSLDEIKAHRDQVVSSNRESEMKKDSEKLLEEYRMKAVEHFTHTDWRGKIDTFAGFDNSMEALAKAGKGALTDSNIRAALRSVGFKSVPQDVVELARQSITSIREAATDYFEAKPQRAVKLKEFKGAVVPKGTDPDVIAALERSGLTVVEYNSKKDGDRSDKVGKLSKSLNRTHKNVLFSKSKEVEFDASKVTTSATESNGNKFETGVPVTFKYLHNKESATKLFGKPNKESPYDRGYEPSGKYVTETDGGKFASDNPSRFEAGELTFENPLVLDTANWKRELSDAFGGLTGKNLSVAIIEAGFDGVVTTNKYGTSEILDLTSFDYKKAKYSQGAESGESITEQQATVRIAAILGDNVAKTLIDSGWITFSDIGKGNQGVTLKDGRIVLNLSALTEDNFDGVLKHEGLHSMLKELVGESTYNQIMSQLEKNLKLAKGNDWVAKAHQRAVAAETNEEYITEEIAGYAVEAVTNGDKTPGFIKRWVDSFLSAIRTALIRGVAGEKAKLLAIKNIKPQDLARLAVAGLKAKSAEIGGDYAGRESVAFSFKRAFSGQYEERQFIVPETGEYLNDESLVDLAYFNGTPIRLQVGSHKGKYGIMHLLGNSEANKSRQADSVTDDVAENAARDIVRLLGQQTLFGHTEEGGKYVLRAPLVGKSIVLRDAGSFWTVQTVLPSAANKWGVEDWKGRLTLPLPASSGNAAPETEQNTENIRIGASAGRDVTSTKFNPNAVGSKRQAEVITKKRRIIVRDGGERFSKAQPSQPKPLPEETKARKAQRLHQDKLNRFTVIKEFLADQGVVLSEQADVYKAEERMHSRFANKVEDFREKLVEPLIKKIQKAGFTMEDVSLFLHAQHAKERNEQVAKVNKDKPDGGSGMLTKDAANVIAATPAELKALANEFRQITEMTKQTLLSSGVVAQDMVDAWEYAYSNYVPLKGGPDEKASKSGTGKGLAVNAKMKRALGHGQREGGEWIAENILADYERAVMLAEKNRVGHHLIKMALEVGREDLITIGKPEKRAILKDSVAYEVRYHGSVVNVFNTLEAAKAFKDGELRGSKTRSPNDFTITKSSDPSVIYSASPMLQDNEVNVYVNGHAVRLQINDELLARAYKNMGQEAMGTILTAGRMLNGYLSKIYTGYNPEFILTNIVRDFTTGLANITGEEGAMFAGKAMTNYARSFGTLLRYAHNGTETKWIKMYREDGGNTGAAYLSDMERLGKEIKTEYDAAKGFTQNLKDGNKVGMWNAAMRNLFNLTLHHVDKINQAGENAMRLAIYQTAIESGQTRAAAASLAKNSTVNFNRRGELGQQANALFLFFNAGVQGTASAAHAHFKGKHRKQAWAVSSGIIALGYMIATSLGDDDEYDKLSDYEKSRNMMIKSGDGWTKIPIPYGYGFFWNLGRTMADAVRKDDFGKMPWHVASSFVGEFTPFGGVVAGDKPDARQLNYALPTVFQIIGAPIVNRTGMGSPIFPESSYDPSKPDYLKMWRNTKGSIADELAQVLKPVAEVSPEVLKYYGRTFTGGAGAFVGSAFDAGKLTYEGADLEVKEMPFVRKFYKEVSVSDARGAYYSAKNEAKEAENELNRARKAGDFKTVAELRTNNQELLALDRYADSLQKRINAARDRQDAIKQSETLTVAEKRLMLKSMERDEEKLYDQFLERFKLRMEDRRKRLKPAA